MDDQVDKTELRFHNRDDQDIFKQENRCQPYETCCDRRLQNAPHHDIAFNDTPQTDTPQTDTLQNDTALNETPQTDTPQTDTPQTNTALNNTPQTDTQQADTPQTNTPQNDTALNNTPQTDTQQADTPQTNTPQNDTALNDTPQTDTPQNDTMQNDTPQNDTSLSDTQQNDTPLRDTPQNDTVQNDTPQIDTAPNDTAQNNIALNDTPLRVMPAKDTPQNVLSDTPLSDTAEKDTQENYPALNDIPLTVLPRNDTAQNDTQRNDTLQSDKVQNDTLQKDTQHNNSQLNKIQIHNLPEALKDEKLINYLVISSFLTFKITVNITSEKRKNKFRKNSSEGSSQRVGSGTLMDHRRCPMSKQCALLALTPEVSSGTLHILTNRRLVYNEEEARGATVELFHNGRSLRLSGSDVILFPEPDDEASLIVCEGVGLSLIQQLKERQEQLQSLQRDFPLCIKEHLPGNTFLINSPEDGKQLVLCCSLKVKDHITRSTDSQDVARPLGLELQTCKISSSIGAPIITFQYDVNTSNCKLNLELC